MTAVRIFDPAMCCSTGVCGPTVDPQLARFSADLDWLKAQGASVERFNLAQQPAAFAEDRAVRAALDANGEASLPLVEVDGVVKSSGVYPSRAELAAWAGIGGPVTEPVPATHARGSSRIMLETASGGCCAPAANQATDEPATKGGKCC